MQTIEFDYFKGIVITYCPASDTDLISARILGEKISEGKEPLRLIMRWASNRGLYCDLKYRWVREHSLRLNLTTWFIYRIAIKELRKK